MKQKYIILINNESNELVIKEFAELDKESMSLLYEEKYKNDAILSAIQDGKNNLISVLRTQNFYPPSLYISEMADAVMSVYKNKNYDKEPTNKATELIFDDASYIRKEPSIVDIEDDFSERADATNELLDEEIDDTFEDITIIDNINPSVRIADEDGLDLDEDTE